MNTYTFIIKNITGTIRFQSKITYPTVSNAQLGGCAFKEHINSIVPNTYNSMDVIEVLPFTN